MNLSPNDVLIPLLHAAVFLKCTLLIFRKRSMDVALEEFLNKCFPLQSCRDHVDPEKYSSKAHHFLHQNPLQVKHYHSYRKYLEL